MICWYLLSNQCWKNCFILKLNQIVDLKSESKWNWGFGKSWIMQRRTHWQVITGKCTANRLHRTMLTNQVNMCQHHQCSTRTLPLSHCSLSHGSLRSWRLNHPVPGKGHRKSMASAHWCLHSLLTQLVSATILPGKLVHGPYVFYLCMETKPGLKTVLVSILNADTILNWTIMNEREAVEQGQSVYACV